MTETKRGGRGGKLARSEVVQVRLDPKLRFAAELAAAKERRTLSSFIEWAVERAVRDIVVHYEPSGGEGAFYGHTAEAVTNSVWDVNEIDRFVNLARRYPGLLTHDEARRWKFIKETRAFWQKPAQGGLEPNLPAIRAAWNLIEEHINEGGPFDWNRFTNDAEERGIAVEYADPKSVFDSCPF